MGSFWSLKGQARGKGRAYTVLSEERRGIFSKLQRDILAFLKSKFEEKEAFRYDHLWFSRIFSSFIFLLSHSL